MKTMWHSFRSLGVSIAIGIILIHSAEGAPVNSWSSLSGGKWEVGSNWSTGSPPTSAESILITNGAMSLSPKTINIDSTTSSGSSSTMTISNLTVSGSGLIHNTLFLQSAGLVTPLHILNGLTITAGGAVSITNSVLLVDGHDTAFFPDDGGILLNTGTMITSNGYAAVGYSGNGSFTVADGTWLAGSLVLGYNVGAVGTLTVAGGTVTLAGAVPSYLQVGGPGQATGTVWLTGGQLTTTNDETEIGVFGVGQAIISNGTWRAIDMKIGASTGGQGTLSLIGGTVAVNNLNVGSGLGTGNVIVSSGGYLVITPTPGSFFAGSGLVVDNPIVLTRGSLLVTNNTTTIGSTTTTGSLTNLGGLLTLNSLALGSGAGSHGTLAMAGGTNILAAGVTAGPNSGTTGSVVMTGGQLVMTNAGFEMILGNAGVGELTVSNGTSLINGIRVGNLAGSHGAVTLAGGTNNLSTIYVGGFSSSATGAVWMAGGRLSNSLLYVGYQGVGQMTVSNGTSLLQDAFAGAVAGGQGTITIAGGSSSMYSSLTLGASDCSATGTVVLAGGNLFVTNAAHSAVFEVRSGTLILNSGVMDVDTFVMTNPCAHFIRTGGTLLYGSAVLSSNRDDDGDGIPNGYEQGHNLDPLNAADANADADGDGMSNLQEYLAGTDATNSASTFRITSIVRTGSNVQVTWMTGIGRTNALQAMVGGNYTTNGFGNIFTVTNTTGTITNYLDVGGATNKPARFYRVRLVP